MSPVLYLLDPALHCSSGGLSLGSQAELELILKSAANTTQVKAVNPPLQH